MSAQPLQRFVRSAWALLLFQLLAAAAAVAVTTWAAFQVRPLLDQREALRVEIAAQREHVSQLEQQAGEVARTNDELRARLSITRQEARVEASQYVRAGINFFHAGDYNGAVRSYNEALARDPDNAYTLDLKSYSQFKAGDLSGAIDTIQAALAADPSYQYGHSVLALYACTAGQYDLALAAYGRARATPGVPAGFATRMRRDGEFSNACAQLRERFTE
jgi:tetratricopeptide (TPR) repeat protein